MELSKFKTGQRVVILGGSPGQSKEKAHATVSKTDQKLVHVVRDGLRPESRYYLRSKSDPYLVEDVDAGGGAFAMLFSDEQAADDFLELHKLRKWFIHTVARWENISQYSAEQLRAVQRILDREEFSL